MDFFIVIFRTIFFYAFIVLIFRIMGKREIGQLSVEDLVVSILIAELVAISIENIDDSLMLTVIPISILVVFEIILSFASLKSARFRRIVEGKPALIINKGKIVYKELIKQRYTLDDLMLELRNNNIKSLEDVEYAILENSGKLNVFKYNFLKLDSTNPFPVILDGKIQNDTLKYIKKSKSWLENKLKENNKDLKNVFYAFYKGNKLYILTKDDLR